MKFIGTETSINESTNLPEIKMVLDHNEVDRINEALTNLLQTRTFNFEEPTSMFDYNLFNALKDFMFKAWEATNVNDPVPINPDTAVVTDAPASTEFVPNQPAEDVAAMETEFTNPPV